MQAKGWVTLTKWHALWKAGPEPCVTRDPQGLEPRRPGWLAGLLTAETLSPDAGPQGSLRVSPRPGRARHMNNECALSPVISIPDWRHR